MRTYQQINNYRKEFILPWYKTKITTEAKKHVKKFISTEHKILDVGCSTNPITQNCDTLDTDTQVQTTYKQWTEIKKKYDIITMFAVIEHLTNEQAQNIIFEAYNKLKVNGKICVSTPNVNHVHIQHYDHKTFWSTGDLYGLLRVYGFENVEVYRCLIPTSSIKGKLAIGIRRWLGVVLDIDLVCDNILVIGTKK